MSGNIDIKRFFSYAEGPNTTTIVVLDNGDVVESTETTNNYYSRNLRATNRATSTCAAIKRKCDSNTPLDKYTNYNKRDTQDIRYELRDVWE